MRITFYGNHSLPWTSESHHCASLEELGCEVVRLQEPSTPAAAIQSEAERSDLFVWVMTHGWHTPRIEDVVAHLRGRGIPTVAYHLDRYMGLPRWNEYVNNPYMNLLDHWFTVDAEQAKWLNENTSVRGHYLPAGVYGAECYMATPSDRFDVCFTGSRNYHPEYGYRKQLLDWLQQSYGDRFRHYGGGGRPTARGADLNQIYADARVVIGDTLCLDSNYAGKYFSDRIFEVCGRGGMIVHPWLYGLDEHFADGEHVVFYKHGDFDDLRMKIDYYLKHDDEREKIRRAGHEHAKANHTYVRRWETILETVFA